jgi:hypothetical protein
MDYSAEFTCVAEMCNTRAGVAPSVHSVNFVALPVYFDTDNERKHIPVEAWVLW